MTTIRHSVLIGLTTLSLGMASYAVQAADTPATAHSAHGAQWGEHMAQRQALLHEKLKLSPAQEPAWTTFIAAAQPRTPDMRPDHAALAKMTAPARLEQWITMSQQRVAVMQTRLSALQTFYATLTPTQQKILDDNVPGGEHSWHHRGEHGRDHK